MSEAALLPPEEANLPVHLLRLTERRTLLSLAEAAWPEPLEVHARITWRVIDPDGDEDLLTGRLWHQASPVKGMTAFWAIPDMDDTDDAEQRLVCVIRASRRHRVGRMVDLPGPGSTSAYWTSAGGRYVDKGTFYAETHPRSPSGARTAAYARQRGQHDIPRAIAQPVIPAEHRWFFQTYGGGTPAEHYEPRPDILALDQRS